MADGTAPVFGDAGAVFYWAGTKGPSHDGTFFGLWDFNGLRGRVLELVTKIEGMVRVEGGCGVREYVPKTMQNMCTCEAIKLFLCN